MSEPVSGSLELVPDVDMTGQAREGRGGVIVRNTLLNLLGQALPAVVGLAATPYVVRVLGVSRFGILSLAWALLGYLTVFDFGLTRATTRFVAQLLDRQRGDRVPAVAWTTIELQLILGVIGGALVAICADRLVTYWLHVPPDLLMEARGCVRALAFALPVILVSNSLRALLEASQRFDLVNVVRVPTNVLFYALPLVGGALGWSLGTILVAFTVAWSCGIVVQFVFCRRVYPDLGWPTALQADQASALLRFGGWVTISGLISPILVYADRLIIGAVLSVAAVSYYTVPFDTITRLLVIPASLVSTLFPLISAASQRGEHERVLQLIGRSSKYLALLLLPVITVVVLCAPELLGRWMGQEFAARGGRVLQILTVGVCANALAQIPFSSVQASGRPDLPAKFHLIELPLYLVFLKLAVNRWGIEGAAATFLGRVVVDALLLYGAAFRIQGVSATAVRDSRLLPLAGMLLSIGALVLAVALSSISLGARILTAFGLLAISALAMRTWIFSPVERGLFATFLAPRQRSG